VVGGDHAPLRLLEAQALWLLGTEPVWDEGGRHRREAGAAQGAGPRVDVVLSATGLYRDHFPNTMKSSRRPRSWPRGPRPTTPWRPTPAHRRRSRPGLPRRPRWRRHAHLLVRIGRYGTGLDDATLATDTWKGKAEGDRKLAQLYLSRMQFAYGPDESTWGSLRAAARARTAALNLYAEHLRGTEGAVLSRTPTSTACSPPTTRSSTWAASAWPCGTWTARRRSSTSATCAARLGQGRGRGAVPGQGAGHAPVPPRLHPGPDGEGYAGTLQVLDATNNFWGWTAVAREIVRDDQWQEMVDVCARQAPAGPEAMVRGHNPHALAQNIERMLEAARQGYWQADAQTVAELKTAGATWPALRRADRQRRLRALCGRRPGHGRLWPEPGLFPPIPQMPPPRAERRRSPAPGRSRPRRAAPTPPPISGMRLEQVAEQPSAPATHTWQALWVALVLGAVMLGGGWWQRRYSFQAKLAFGA
jgi:cobaltochelatase CobN